MSTSVKIKKLSKSNSTAPIQLSLVMNGHNPFWKSDLFDKTYLENDVPVVFKEMWELDEAGPFYEFLNGFMDICEILKNENLGKWNEQNTTRKIIEPVLRLLGYYDKAGPNGLPFLENESFTIIEHGEPTVYRPDLIFVDDPKESKHINKHINKNPSDKLSQAQRFVILPVEAKRWEELSPFSVKATDSKKGREKNVKSEDKMEPDDQILKYMEFLEKDYGILTDGKIWRLYNREISTQNKERFFEFNLGQLMFHVQGGVDKHESAYSIFVANAKYFYHIFSKKSIYGNKGKDKFVDKLLEFSKKYVTKVEEDLKERFVKAMSIACNGFKNESASGKSEVDLELLRNVAESHLFNILFIRFCEVRNILPVKQDPTGYRLISISNILDKLEEYDPELEEDGLNLDKLKENFKSFDYQPNGYQLYDSLIKLTKIIQNGASKQYDNFEIEGFKKTIFSKDEWKFAEANKLTNEVMVSILFQLGYSKPEVKVKGHTYQQIPYNFFSPRQLGSIYESFLEFKIDKASEDMVFIKKQWQAANLKSEKVRKMDVPKVRKGDLFFTPNNEARKVTGAYYTPDPVVQLIIRETLGPLVKGKKSADILKMKVADVAMGSAHFLSGALSFLAQQYLEKLKNEKLDDVDMTLTEAKQLVLHNCIYGADINPRAVKLTKMSLWLESASMNRTLEELDDQIKCTNSLTDYNLWKKEWKFLDNGIDAVVGNPPYLGEKGHKEVFQEISNEWLGKRFYNGKMDLFYFFFHLGLDILKDNGRLGFITTNYFTTALGAKLLREDLYERANLDTMINLNELRVFGEAGGQHNMITVLTKTKTPGITKIVDSHETGECTVKILSEIYSGVSKKSKTWSTSKEQIFDGDSKILRLTNAVDNPGTGNKANGITVETLELMRSSPLRLKDIAEISQGFTPNPDKVNKRNIAKISAKILSAENVKIGDGVFVLTEKELIGLNLNKEEMLLVKQYLEPKDLQSATTVKFNNKKYLLYLTESTCPDISKYKNLHMHLAKYKEIMEERRETQQGRREWYHLHWPKDSSFFENEGIVSVRMTSEPTFCWNPGSIYFDLGVNVIKMENKKIMKLLFTYLCSPLVSAWLRNYGKVKGSQLQVDGAPLENIPVPDFSNYAGSIQDKQSILDYCEQYFKSQSKSKKKRSA